MFDFSLFLNCLSDRSLISVITDSIPDLSALISNVKNSIVCSCFGQSISHSRGKPCVAIMGFFYRSLKKRLKLVGWFLNLYIKTAMWTVTSSNILITFKSLKRGLVCSKKLENDSNGFLLQYKKRLQRSLISIAPSY